MLSAPRDEHGHAGPQAFDALLRTGAHLEGLDVVAARLARRAPRRVFALGAHVVDAERHGPATERRDGRGDLAPHADVAKLVLARHEAFLVEGVDAAERHFREARGRSGTLPIRLGGAHVFLPHAAVEQLLASDRAGARGLRLAHAGFGLGTVEGHEQRAGLDVLAFADVELRDAPRDLGRDVDIARVELALQRRAHGAVGEIQAVHG